MNAKLGEGLKQMVKKEQTKTKSKTPKIESKSKTDDKKSEKLEDTNAQSTAATLLEEKLKA